MIEIMLARRERDIIRHWIEHEQTSHSVAGDAPNILPDEEIVERKLERALSGDQ